MESIVLWAALLFGSFCGTWSSATGEQQPIEVVLAEHSERLLQIEGVVGVAQGDSEGKPCILVLALDAHLAHRLPQSVGGYPVVVQQTGPIGPLSGQ
jgi:hypothetical protein